MNIPVQFVVELVHRNCVHVSSLTQILQCIAIIQNLILF